MIPPGPGWLPALVDFADHAGDWDAYLEALYVAFQDDWVRRPPTDFDGKRVALKKHPELEGKSATFWHFISSGPVEDERLPDLRRCERIRWPRAMMDAIESGNICAWKNDRRGEVRYIVALTDFSYVLVIADRGEYVLPWTAYTVEQEHRRQKLEDEYQAAKKGWCRP